MGGKNQYSHYYMLNIIGCTFWTCKDNLLNIKVKHNLLLKSLEQ